MFTKALSSVLMAGTLAFGAVSLAHADDYPSRTITIVVPFAPGGASDITARLIAEQLSDGLDVPVIVDNRSGANSQIGTMAVAQAKPDGYTLLMGTTSLINNPLLYKDLPYDADTDLRPVAGVVDVPAFLMVGSSLGVDSAEEFIEMATKEGTTLNYGSAGAGSTLHLAVEHLKMAEGIDALHIPYKGSGPASLGVASGEVDFSMENYGPALGHIKGERTKVLALAAPERFPNLPDVPTFAEVGLDDTDLSSWFGLFAPSETPDDIVELLNSLVNEALEEESVQKRIFDMGLVPLGGSPDDMQARMESDKDLWGTIISTANVSVE